MGGGGGALNGTVSDNEILLKNAENVQTFPQLQASFRCAINVYAKWKIVLSIFMQ